MPLNNKSSKELWWRPAMVIFAQVTGWIAVPIVSALFIGRALDEKYNSEPWIFLGLTAAAFAISCFGIVTITIKYVKKIEKEAKVNKKNTDSSQTNHR